MRSPTSSTLWFLFAAGAIALTGSLQPVEAQVVPSSYDFIDTRHDVGVMVSRVTDARGRLRTGPGGGNRLSVLYGFELTGPIAVEASAFVLPTDREIYDPMGDSGLEHIGNADALMLGFEGRIRFTLTGRRTWRGFAPFLLGGGGWTWESHGTSPLELDQIQPESLYSFGNSILALVGAGTRWFPSERFGLRLETTIHLWKLRTPQGFLALEGELGPIAADEWVGPSSITLGGSIHF